jgi:hypothetical protein
MRVTGLLWALVLLAGVARAGDGQAYRPDNAKVVALTRFLEERPLDQQAPVIRASLVQWEADSKDVLDTVCAGVLAPLPDASIKYSGELLAQFILGSAAHQLSEPGDRGKLMPAQLAGMRSLLKAYGSLIGADKAARIPRFDELASAESAGNLEQTLTPLVIQSCLPADHGSGRFPWAFGMSHAQVAAVAGFGPYRSFQNGDLETYNAVFDGRFNDFQLFFHDDKLGRIGVYTFEGTDVAAAVDAWAALYAGMQRTFGAIETPGNVAPVAGDAASLEAFKTRARAMVDNVGKIQMAPMKQPADVFSFASFVAYEVQGTRFYDTILYFDPPHPPTTDEKNKGARDNFGTSARTSGAAEKGRP